MHTNSRCLQTAIDGLRVVPWTARPGTWTVLSIGAGIERVLGYRRQDWRAKGFWFDHVHADDRDGLRASLERATHHESCAADVHDYRIHDNRGDIHWMRTSTAPLESGSRTLSGA